MCCLAAEMIGVHEMTMPCYSDTANMDGVRIYRRLALAHKQILTKKPNCQMGQKATQEKVNMIIY